MCWSGNSGELRQDPYFEFKLRHRSRSRREESSKQQLLSLFFIFKDGHRLWVVTYAVFLCWIECFFFTQAAFQIQMDSNCKGWGPASPFKGFTSTGDHLSNKQTNKEKAFRFPWRRKKRLWAEKERIKWKSSVATGSIDPWPNFEQIHFVTLSVNRQHFHVARKASFLDATASPKP